MVTITSDKLIGIYVKMRDVVAAKEKVFKAEKKSIGEKMEVIAKELRKRLKADEVKSIKSDSGTVFETKKEFVGIEDFDDFLRFLIGTILDCVVDEVEQRDIDSALQHAELQFLNKAVNKTATLEWMEENEGKLPPGIKYSSEFVIQVRK